MMAGIFPVWNCDQDQYNRETGSGHRKRFVIDAVVEKNRNDKGNSPFLLLRDIQSARESIIKQFEYDKSGEHQS